MKIKIPDMCLSCLFNQKREMKYDRDHVCEINYCILHKKEIEYLDEKPSWCMAKELGETEEIRKQTAGEIIEIINDLWDNPPLEGSTGYNTGFSQANGMLKARIQKKYLEG